MQDGQTKDFLSVVVLIGRGCPVGVAGFVENTPPKSCRRRVPQGVSGLGWGRVGWFEPTCELEKLVTNDLQGSLLPARPAFRGSRMWWAAPKCSATLRPHTCSAP